MSQNQPFTNGQGPEPAVTAEQWAAGFRAANGREPTTNEFQAAQAAGFIAKDRDPSLQQMTAGLKQFAGGAKGLYSSRVAPAVERSGAKDFFTEKVAPAARSAADRVQQEAAPSGSLAGWIARAPKLLPVVAFVAILSLFLPMASKSGRSINFFYEDVRGEGITLLVLFLGLMAASGWLLLGRKKVAIITTGVLGIVAGIFALLDGFVNMFILSTESRVAVGLGLICLAATGAAMLAGGLCVLIGLKALSARA